MFLDKLFPFLSTSNSNKNKSVLWIIKDRLGRNTYEYNLNIGIECENILHCYKMYNIAPNMFYGANW